MDGLEEIINKAQELINKTEDKETLEILGSLNKSLQDLSKEQEKASRRIELLEEDNKFYKDAYKESIKFGGFVKEQEPMQDVVEAQPQHQSIEEALEQFMQNKENK
jgi:hypothetical protein